MTSNIENIIRQFTQLTRTEQQELIYIIRTKTDGQGGNIKHRGGGVFGENMGPTTINFAPTPGRCPRCGK